MAKIQSSKKNPIIITKKLSKFYNQIPVVDDLNLEIFQSSFALLGPNGAGKTTTILMLLNLIKPTKGNAYFFGLDIKKDAVEIRKRVGYLPENIGFNSNITGRQYLKLFYKLRTPINRNNLSTDSLLDWCGLDERYWDKKIKTYSQGMKQRLGIAIAFAGNPDVVFLDEPLSNIDPLGRAELIEKIKEKQREGITIIISSHIVLEIEKIVDSIAIIHKGNLKVADIILNLTQKYGLNEYEILNYNNITNNKSLDIIFDEISNKKELLLTNPTLLSDKIIVKTKKPTELKKLITRFDGVEMRPISGTLEKIYKKFVI
jgi:ABC-2 type transport system ATP-binding protein